MTDLIDVAQKFSSENNRRTDNFGKASHVLVVRFLRQLIRKQQYHPYPGHWQGVLTPMNSLNIPRTYTVHDILCSDDMFC